MIDLTRPAQSSKDFFASNPDPYEAEEFAMSVLDARDAYQPEEAVSGPQGEGMIEEYLETGTASDPLESYNAALADYREFATKQGREPFALADVVLKRREAADNPRRFSVLKNLAEAEGEAFENLAKWHGLDVEKYRAVADIPGMKEKVTADIIAHELTGHEGDVAKASLAKELGITSWKPADILAAVPQYLTDKQEEVDAYKGIPERAFNAALSEEEVDFTWIEKVKNPEIRKRLSSIYGQEMKLANDEFGGIAHMVRPFLDAAADGNLDTVAETSRQIGVDYYDLDPEERQSFQKALHHVSGQEGKDIEGWFQNVGTSIGRGFENIIEGQSLFLFRQERRDRERILETGKIQEREKIARNQSKLVERDATPEEMQDAKRDLGFMQLMADVRANRDLMNRTDQSSITMRGSNMVAGSIPYFIAFASPYTGTLAATSYMQESREKLRREAPDLDAKTLDNLSAAIGGGEAAVQQIQNLTLGLGGGKAILPKGFVKNWMTRTLKTGAAETAEEIAQQFVYDAGKAIGQQFNEAVPDARFGETLDQLIEQSPELLITGLFFGAFGASMSTTQDLKLGKTWEAASPEEKVVSGFSPEAIARVDSEASPIQKAQAYREEWQKQDPEERNANLAALDVKALAESASLAGEARAGDLEFIENRTITEEAIREIQSYQLETGEKFTVEKGRAQTLLDNVTETNRESIIAAGRQSARSAGMDVAKMSDDQILALEEAGSVRLRSDLAGMAVRIAEGADALTFYEEVGEGTLRLAEERGEVNAEDIVADLQALEPSLLAENGKATRYIPEDYDSLSREEQYFARVEGFSNFVKAYAIEQAVQEENPDGPERKLTLPESVGAALRKLFHSATKHFRMMVDSARAIMAARQSGDLSQDLTALADRALGLNWDYYAQQQERRAQEEILAETQPDRVSEAVKGKLPRPDDEVIAGDPSQGIEPDPLRGELQAIWDSMTTKAKGRGKSSKAAAFFAKKGEGTKLDDLRQSLNEDGFDFETPSEMLEAILNDLESTPSFAVKNPQDAAYLSAVDSGDMETAQAMVDEAAKKAGYDSPKLYHGTDDARFDSFNSEKAAEKSGQTVHEALENDDHDLYEPGVVWATTSPIVAESYRYRFGETEDNPVVLVEKKNKLTELPDEYVMRLIGQGKSHPISKASDIPPEFLTKGGKLKKGRLGKSIQVMAGFGSPPISQFPSWADGGSYTPEAAIEQARQKALNVLNAPSQQNRHSGVLSLYAKLGKTKVLDYKGENFRKPAREVRRYTYSEEDSSGKVTEAEADTVIFKNVRDVAQTNLTKEEGISDVYALKESWNPKSADPVTYDEAGNVIPLSKRFDETRDEISFSVGRAKVTPTSESREFPTIDGRTLFGPASFSIRAHHGTPHKVDKFTTDKIGAGEGAQAYGWGLYFAEDKRVASQYREKLSYKDFVSKFELPSDIDFEGLMEEVESGAFPAEVTLFIKALASDDWLGFDYPSQAISAALNAKTLQDFDPSPELVEAAQLGNLYTVNLKAEDGELLDWDNPLDEQSEEAINKLLSSRNEMVQKYLRDIQEHYPREPMRMAYFEFSRLFESPEKASEFLYSLGIKGIRYLDGNSRGNGEGSYNYVIFSEEDIEILEENGNAISLSQRFDETRDEISFAVRAPGQSAEMEAELNKLFKGVADTVQVGKKIQKRLALVQSDWEKGAYGSGKKTSQAELNSKALAQLDAVIGAFPMEVRGKLAVADGVGQRMTAYQKLSTLKTQGERNLYITSRIAKAGEVFEKYLQKEYQRKIKRQLDQGKAGKTTSGNPRAKMGVFGHRVFGEVRDILALDDKELRARAETYGKRLIENDFQSHDEQVIAQIFPFLHRIFGDYGNADTHRLDEALNFLSTTYKLERDKMLEKMTSKKAERDLRLASLAESMGQIDLPEDDQVNPTKRPAGEAFWQATGRALRSGLQLFDLLATPTGQYDGIDPLNKSIREAASSYQRKQHEAQERLKAKLLEIGGKTNWQTDSWLSQARTEIDNPGVTWANQRNSREVTIRKVDLEHILANDIRKMTVRREGDDGSMENVEVEIDADVRENLQRQWEKFQELPLDTQGRRRVISFYHNFAEKANGAEPRREFAGLTQMKALHLKLMIERPSMRAKMFRAGYDEVTLAEINEFIAPETHEIGRWMVSELQARGLEVSEVFEDLKSLPFPQEDGYFPASFDPAFTGQADGLDPEGAKEGRKGVEGGFLKAPIHHNAPPKPRDALDIFQRHIEESNHYVTHARLADEWGKVLRNRDFRRRAMAAVGEKTTNAIIDQMSAIESGFSPNHQTQNGLVDVADYLRRTTTKTTLAYRISTIAVQLSASVKLSQSLPATKFLQGTVGAIANPSAFKEAWNSPAMRLRAQDGSRAIQITEQQGVLKGSPLMAASERLSNKPFWLIRNGEALANTIAGGAVWKYHFDQATKAGLDESAAKSAANEELDKALAAFAQPTQGQNLSTLGQYLEGSKLGKNLMPFTSEPAQNLGNALAVGLHGIITGKGRYSRAHSTQIFLTSWAILGMFEALVRAGLEELQKEDDDDNGFDKFSNPKFWAFQLAAGPLNWAGIPAVVADLLSDATDQKTYSGGTLTESVLRGARNVPKLMDSEKREAMSDDELISNSLDAIKALGSLHSFTVIFAQAAQIADQGKDLYQHAGGERYLTKEDEFQGVLKDYSALNKLLPTLKGLTGEERKRVESVRMEEREKLIRGLVPKDDMRAFLEKAGDKLPIELREELFQN